MRAPEHVKLRLQREVNPNLDKLSPRAETVLHYIAQGLDNAAIAAEMGVSTKTVENYVNDIFRKLGLDRTKGLHSRVCAALQYPHQLQDAAGLPALVRLVAATEQLTAARDSHEAAIAEFEAAQLEVEAAVKMSIYIRPTPEESRPRGMQP